MPTQSHLTQIEKTKEKLKSLENVYKLPSSPNGHCTFQPAGQGRAPSFPSQSVFLLLLTGIFRHFHKRLFCVSLYCAYRLHFHPIGLMPARNKALNSTFLLFIHKSKRNYF